jgi:3'-phosphoadenosine 5'-phosphosulfate sulfotransferase (PAPS reductase)/FAD synthetase
MSGYIKDRDCTKDIPVVYGMPDRPVYGQETPIRPRVQGRADTEHMQKIFLPELLPLEEYDLIAVLLSGGKDSIASYYKLRELGVPKEKMEFWHHDIDGGHPSRRMDWRCTQNYVRAFAEAENVPLRLSWRVNGFFGELYRIGASEPVEWEEPETGEVRQCRPSPNYLKCLEIKEKATEDIEEQLRQMGYRMKFPAKTGDLSRRWCSAYLKVMVADAVMVNLDRLEQLGGKCHRFPAKGSIGSGRWCSAQLKREVADAVIRNLDTMEEAEERRKGSSAKKVLVVSGERRGESASRAGYNEMEVHRTNAEKRAHRTVHQWRPVIDYSEKDVWEVLKRHNINPHPCYRAGWNRCSCAMCIFSTPSLFAGIRELYPEDFKQLQQDERILGFTLDNKCDLDTFIGNAKSCVYHGDPAAVQSLLTGEFTIDDVYVKGRWMYPAGAFHGAEGGPC